MYYYVDEKKASASQHTSEEYSNSSQAAALNEKETKIVRVQVEEEHRGIDRAVAQILP